MPHIRTKRGILNAVGSLYKWSFGLLDSEDGERYDQAITKNQQSMYQGLNNQITLSHKLINRLNNSLTAINDNQQSILKHIEAIDHNNENLFLAITAARYICITHYI